MRYIYGTVEYICMVEFASCFLWIAVLALDESKDEINNQCIKCCRDDGGKKKENDLNLLAMLSWTSGTGFWEEKGPVYMSDVLYICVQEDDYV